MSRRRPATPTVASSGRRSSRVTVTGKGIAVRRWRYAVRPRVLHSVVSTTKSLSWSSALLRVLLEELHEGANQWHKLWLSPVALREAFECAVCYSLCFVGFASLDERGDCVVADQNIVQVLGRSFSGDSCRIGASKR